MPEHKTIPGGVDNSARASKGSEGPAKRIPGERRPVDRIKTKQESEKDPILAILNGGASSDNETVNYFIDKIRSISDERVTLNEELRSIIAAKVAVERRLAEIEVEGKAYMKDAAEWHARPQAAPPEVTDPTP